MNITVGQGGDAIKLDKPLDTIAAGETKTVEIHSQTLPRRAKNVPITVEIEGVPGEEARQQQGSFAAIFTHDRRSGGVGRLTSRE